MTDPLDRYAAVVFDFDGTLADSFAAIASSVNHVRALRGMPVLGVDEVKRHVGHGAEYLLTHTVPGGVLADDLARYRAHHPGIMLPLTQLLPGAAELVTRLHRRGKKLGVCSNKPRIFTQQLLNDLQLATYFDVVLGPEDVAKPKPAPDMLLRAVERLGLPKPQVLYIGDMTVDIQTARSAGIAVWVAPTGTEERRVLADARPDRLLCDLQELADEIERA